MSIGAFGDKVFEVSENKIYTFDDLSVSEGLDIEVQTTEGSKPSIYIKGVKEKTVSFSITLYSRYVNVEAEIEWWKRELICQTPEYLTIGNRTMSICPFLLTEVNESDVVLSPNGRIIKAKLDLNFTEYVRAGYKKN